ncbi:PREDICTED: putative uncharacterized protein DDB_G0289963 [Eufriesea mexicana]|uniref:putative uncharacterized protein DDB_G0289963 n=1 Tax=Eufriesea mexicana TaxID=516756 RepID=UPI00083BB57C|nr:PREDICTED: putative uncharacterized protein DDB_G0289963 [Eufriesea mexicana]
MNISRSSLDSTFNGEESNSRVNLNNAMLLSIDDEILSNSGDESFFDAHNSVFSLSNEETKTDTSTSINVEQTKHISCSLEHSNSTSLILFSLTKSHLSCKNNDYTDNSIQNSNNFQFLQNKDMKQENFVTNKHIPLRILLKQMLDEILGKCSRHIKQSHTTCSNRYLSNECLINSSNSIKKSDNTFEINNNDPCLTQNHNNMIATSIENVTDTDQIDASSSQDISVCLSSKLVSNQLVTILEDSNENTSNSQLKDSPNWSAKYVAKVTNFSFKKLESIGKKLFITSDISDNETTTSSNMSSDIEILNKKICQQANN